MSGRRYMEASDAFDFGASEFDMPGRRGKIASDALDLSNLDLEPEMGIPQSPYGDLQESAPVREPTEDEVVFEVEDALIELLAQEARTELMAITGARPDLENVVDADASEEFSQLYTRAQLANPAIKWYAKFVELLTPAQFCVQADEVNLSIPQDVFRKAVVPFLSDFKAEWEEDSPLVRCVRKLAERYVDSRTSEAFRSRKMGAIKKNVRSAAEHFSVEDVVFGSDPSDSEMTEATAEVGSVLADLSLQDDVFGNPEETASDDGEDRSLDIALSDLSTKAVADYCAARKLSSDEIRSYLLDEGFALARANEVVAIARFAAADARRRATGRQDGSWGSGTEFEPR